MPAAGSDDGHGEVVERLAVTHVQLYHLKYTDRKGGLGSKGYVSRMVVMGRSSSDWLKNISRV